MKKVVKFLGSFGLSCLVGLYLLFAPKVVLKKLLLEQDNLNRVQEGVYYGVIDMWHIESFEGGSVSRSSYLQKMAMEFEKQNKGSYVVVNLMSLESALLNIQNGQMPNLISFSLGLGEKVQSILQEYKGKKVGLESLILGGQHSKKQLAMPYMLGGYVGVDLNKGATSFGNESTNLTSLAAALFKEEGFAVSTNEKLYNCDTYNAYNNFINGKSSSLIGTQRDVARLNNRINNGSLNACEYEYLSGFSDLVQYIGMSKKNNEQESALCEKFIEHLLSKTSQEALSQIGMFSVLEECEHLGAILDFEKKLKNNLKTVNVFLSESTIANIKNDSLLYIENKMNSINNIKKYLI